jgi:hypothetical protein
MRCSIRFAQVAPVAWLIRGRPTRGQLLLEIRRTRLVRTPRGKSRPFAPRRGPLRAKLLRPVRCRCAPNCPGPTCCAPRCSGPGCCGPRLSRSRFLRPRASIRVGPSQTAQQIQWARSAKRALGDNWISPAKIRTGQRRPVRRRSVDWPCLVCTRVRSCVVPKSSRSSLREGPDAPGPSLGVGAQVRLRQRQTTGVVIGYSPHRSRVWVRWEDTGEVTHILIANLERVPAVSK